MQNMPSPWMSLSIEKMQEIKDRYKLANDIEKEAMREKELAKKKETQEASTQMQAMKDTLPFLGQ